MRIGQLIIQAIKTGFPLFPFVMGLIQHLAPRVVQAQGYASQPIRVYNSILAGCKFAVAFTRAYLKLGVQHVCLMNRDALVNTYVDDAPFHATGQPEDLVRVLTQTALDFGHTFEHRFPVQDLRGSGYRPHYFLVHQSWSQLGTLRPDDRGLT